MQPAQRVETFLAWIEAHKEQRPRVEILLLNKSNGRYEFVDASLYEAIRLGPMKYLVKTSMSKQGTVVFDEWEVLFSADARELNLVPNGHITFRTFSADQDETHYTVRYRFYVRYVST